MSRLAISVSLLVLTTSFATAQGLNPAIELEGAQTQSLDLAKDAVNVTVDTSGALSLGQGSADGGGSLGVSVNGLSIGASTPDRENPSQAERDIAGDAAAQPVSAGAQGGGSVGAGQVSAMATGTGSLADEMGCGAGAVSASELNGVMAEGRAVRLEPANCISSDDSAARLVADEVVIRDALEERGIAANQVVSITISNDFVTLGLRDWR